MGLSFVQGKRLWSEDDADVHGKGHEGPEEAWARITGTKWEWESKREEAFVMIDYGDSEDFIIGCGDVWYRVSRSWPGNSEIWELVLLAKPFQKG